MKKIRAPLAVIFLVIFMYVIAQLINDKEIIFPEIAALGVGAWFIKNSPWGKKPLYLWLSPTLAAITGVGMLHFLSVSKEILIAVTFLVVLLELLLMRSAVLPSISAAILPIVVNANSLYYILSVCVLSGMIAAGRGMLNYLQLRDNLASQEVAAVKEVPQTEWRKTAIYWLKRFIGVMIVATFAARSNWIYIIAPPLIVTFIEFANTAGKVYRQPVRLFGLMLSAAFSGTLWVELIHLQFYWPLWIAALCSVIFIFFLFNKFNITFPPAAAIALLPTIIPVEMLWFYPFEVAAGVAIFIVFGKIINRNVLLTEPD